MKLKSSKSAKNADFLTLGVILLFCLVYRSVYFRFINNIALYYNADGVSYFTSGIFDLYRTPLYPLIIRLFESIFKDNFMSNIVYFQQLISFLSIIPVFYFLKNTLKNNRIIIPATLIYSCIPYSLIQNVNINPESLCIAGSAFILFLVSYYVKKPQKSIAFCSGLFPFVLIMLKPTYLIVLCIMFLFFTGRFIFRKNERRILYWGMSGLIIATSGVLGYCEMNKKQNGDYTLSKIALNNSLANIVISGAYKYGGDEELISIIDSTKQRSYYLSAFLLNNEFINNYKISNKKFPKNLPPTWDMEGCINTPDVDNYSYARLNKFVKQCEYTKLYFKYISKQFINAFLYYDLLWFVIIFELIMMFLLFLEYKKILWTPVLCILFIIGQFITVVIGGIGDWDRLILPTYPFILLVFSFFIDMIWSCKKKLIEIISEIY